MEDLHIRKDGRAGRITFTRETALNALSHAMALALEDALDAWRDDPQVALVVIDAQGPRAFCAGGDIAAVYHAGIAGDFAVGRDFWRDEYRMNAKIAEYPKPIVAFMQGFIMGGGVGVGGHASHPVVGDTSIVAMPESGIGLIPDVGGTWILGRAPGRLGEYLGITGARMGPGDAIHAGFARHYLPEAEWPAAIAALVETGDPARLPERPAPASPMAAAAAEIDAAFSAPDLAGIIARLQATGSDLAQGALKAIGRNSALSMAATLHLVRSARAAPDIRAALTQEFRFTWRACEKGDFLEGVRAQIIDKDRNPKWKFADIEALDPGLLEEMLAPLPPEAAIWEEE
ncbi:enoyl-CoA hydratase/isomerase family protein [Phaeovulum vinaykumarii]|uniref:3-hydroxyisobutyryl-CoA hydrolase n=1 Tax=Phaeovulum vinaykumarii TaxID=407234 RepID=A0A1N7KY16_9RHOB|nr:enoyl-CoA hydratase/isomerase family protein [Phaeovulum vinaykumarii]SIS66396.1 Enoyl-CoA hydratase/carnithine racemase [Phaeovulum vinaykumarii]SOC01094.1 enoyl-CoA hydratase/carnithine racemase [Phaeovulum vinaykumarii]